MALQANKSYYKTKVKLYVLIIMLIKIIHFWVRNDAVGKVEGRYPSRTHLLVFGYGRSTGLFLGIWNLRGGGGGGVVDKCLRKFTIKQH